MLVFRNIRPSKSFKTRASYDEQKRENLVPTFTKRPVVVLASARAEIRSYDIYLVKNKLKFGS